MEEGLSQNTVLSILQDRDGFIWLGTEDGLNRYDGSGFVVYKNDPGDPTSLPYNGVWAIEEDPSGDLWIGTEGGGVRCARSAAPADPGGHEVPRARVPRRRPEPAPPAHPDPPAGIRAHRARLKESTCSCARC